MAKKTNSRITSKINKICKLILEKNNKFGFINAKNVSIQRITQAKESAITDLKFLKLFNIQKQHLFYINII